MIAAPRVDTPARGPREPLPPTPLPQGGAAPTTGGALVVLAAELPPGSVVPAHVHDDDQINVVLSGTVGATIDDRELRLEAGSVLLLPRGLPHSLRNLGDEPARMLEIYT